MLYERWNIFVTKLFGLWCQYYPTYMLTVVYSYLRWNMWFLWISSLCGFYLLGYHILFFYWGKLVVLFSGIFDWGKLIILFLYIWLNKTGGSILGVLFWLRNTGIILEILSWIKIDMPYIINCDIWIRTYRLENNWQGFPSVDTNFEASK